MNKPLIAVTTYNKIEMTKESAEWFQDLGHDLLYIDDCSTDGTQEYLNQIRVLGFMKDKRMGLTHSWNFAYKYWKNSKVHSHLILCNNDVLIPKGAVENLMSEHYPLTVPLCNTRGAGYACKGQKAGDYSVSHLQKLQDKSFRDFDKLEVCWTGFCMCFSRGIVSFEREDGNLFDPRNINVGNDDDLASRVTAHLALGSFVYHYKGVSFDGKIAGRNEI
jgi:glycosyltransferase involved in cell wall biosynthesis